MLTTSVEAESSREYLGRLKQCAKQTDHFAAILKKRPIPWSVKRDVDKLIALFKLAYKDTCAILERKA